MNKINISKDSILEMSVLLLQDKTAEDFNIRNIAKVCNVSVGTIYNYFSTKQELEIAVIEQMWNKTFNNNLFDLSNNKNNFCDTIEILYECIHTSQKKYNNLFLMHKTFVNKNSLVLGKSTMEKYFVIIKKVLLDTLINDRNIKNDIFNHEELVDFVFDFLLYINKNKDKNIQILIKLLKNNLYY